MPTRPNILSSASARQNYVQGVLLLKNQFTGVTTSLLGIPGPARPVSTWDRFVAWHHAAMGFAHSRPLFLPWHRLMLRTLEQLLQQVLSDPEFGLPYWDWAADGQRTRRQQLNSAIWSNDCMGRGATAPGAFTAAAFPVRLAANAQNGLQQVNRPLRRDRGIGVTGLSNPSLPTRAATFTALGTVPYDVAPWNQSSTGFRNRVEGWWPSNDLHNRVHVWVGGDMLPSSSPNDPVFFLNHCPVDRLWEAGMQRNGRNYRPTSATRGAPVGHRRHDAMASPFGPSVTPAQVLNMTAGDTYESLEV